MRCARSLNLSQLPSASSAASSYLIPLFLTPGRPTLPQHPQLKLVLRQLTSPFANVRQEFAYGRFFTQFACRRRRHRKVTQAVFSVETNFIAFNVGCGAATSKVCMVNAV